MGQQQAKWQNPSREAVFFSFNREDERNSRLVNEEVRKTNSIRPMSKNTSRTNHHSSVKKPPE